MTKLPFIIMRRSTLEAERLAAHAENLKLRRRTGRVIDAAKVAVYRLASITSYTEARVARDTLKTALTYEAGAAEMEQEESGYDLYANKDLTHG